MSDELTEGRDRMLHDLWQSTSSAARGDPDLQILYAKALLAQGGENAESATKELMLALGYEFGEEAGLPTVTPPKADLLEEVASEFLLFLEERFR